MKLKVDKKRLTEMKFKKNDKECKGRLSYFYSLFDLLESGLCRSRPVLSLMSLVSGLCLRCVTHLWVLLLVSLWFGLYLKRSMIWFIMFF